MWSRLVAAVPGLATAAGAKRWDTPDSLAPVSGQSMGTGGRPVPRHLRQVPSGQAHRRRLQSTARQPSHCRHHRRHHAALHGPAAHLASPLLPFPGSGQLDSWSVLQGLPKAARTARRPSGATTRPSPRATARPSGAFAHSRPLPLPSYRPHLLPGPEHVLLPELRLLRPLRRQR